MGISLAGVSLAAIPETLNYFMFVQCIRRVKQHTKVLCFFFSPNFTALFFPEIPSLMLRAAPVQ